MTEHLSVYFCSMHVGYTSDPRNVSFCENQPVPTMFTVTCQYNSTIIVPNWLVTGLASMSDPTIISRGVTSGPFISQSRQVTVGVSESTLTVNSQEVTATTCFQCSISTVGSGNFRSNQGCVTTVGEWYAQRSVVQREEYTHFSLTVCMRAHKHIIIASMHSLRWLIENW